MVPSIFVASHSPDCPFAFVTLNVMDNTDVTWWEPQVAKNCPDSLPLYASRFRLRVPFNVFSVRSVHVTSHAPDLHFGAKCQPAVKFFGVDWKPLEETKVNFTLKSPSSLASPMGGVGVETFTRMNRVWSSPAFASTSYVYFLPGSTESSLKVVVSPGTSSTRL